MATYVVLLRALNVGGRTVRMADLRTALEESGLGAVETYIQTGNVRFTTGLRSRDRVEEHVERALGDACGFEVPAIALTPAELREVYVDALGLPSPLPGDPRRYVTFLKQPASPDGAAPLDGWDIEGERAAVRGRVVHWWLSKPTQQARLSNARIEKALGVGTTRDLKVVAALAERWGG